MSAKNPESGTGLTLTRVKPKRGKVRQTRAATVADQTLAPREGLLAHAWIDRDLSWLDFNRRVLHMERIAGRHRGPAGTYGDPGMG